MFSIEVVRGYRLELFREDLKRLYDLTGVQQENTVFLFTDTQATRASALIACSITWSWHGPAAASDGQRDLLTAMWS